MTRDERILELLASSNLNVPGILGAIDATIASEFNCSSAAARAARLRLRNTRSNIVERKPQEVKPDPNQSNRGDKCLIDWENEQYVFLFSDREPFDVPFAEVAAMVRAYVYKGGNMVQTAVCRMVFRAFGRKLTHDYFKRMLKTMDINKSSLPFAPHEMETLDAKAAVADWREGKEAAIESAYETTKNDHWERQYRKLKEEMLALRDATLKVEPSDWKPSYPVGPAGPKNGSFRPVFVFSDWHTGAEGAKPGNHAVDAAIEEMRQLGYGTARPIIIFGGDMVDGPAGSMYPGQGSEQYVRYAAQVRAAQMEMRYAVRKISEFYFGAKVDVIAIPGNHGRGSAVDRDDPWRIPEQLLYLWLEDSTKHIARWHMRDDATSKFVSYFDGSTKTQILVYHGDNVPGDWRRIIWSHRDKRAEHFLLVHGHLHTPASFEDIGVLDFQVGGLKYKDAFASERLGVGARVSQQILLLDPIHGPRFPGQVVL